MTQTHAPGLLMPTLGVATPAPAPALRSPGGEMGLDALRDDLAPESAADTEIDEDGRPFHVHPDGAVHYLDQQ